MRLLFLGGPSRSGTTALADYLNLHEEILLCQERYKYVCDRVTPSYFTFDRILEYQPQQGRGRTAETNASRVFHAELIAGKDPARLRWIGDKYPNYVRWLDTLRQNNPGARFVITYRPVEEVAESYEERSKDPRDPWLGGRDGFRLGIEHWNESMRRTRDFIESRADSPVLIVSYHHFFGNAQDFVPLLSRFLEIDFDDSVCRAWREMSQRFESGRRNKEPLSDRQASLTARHKEDEAERWILDRIARQWDEPELYLAKEGYDARVTASDPRSTLAALTKPNIEAEELDGEAARLQRRGRELENALAEQRRHAKTLRRNNRVLSSRIENSERQIQATRSSRVWRFLSALDEAHNRLTGRRSEV